MEIIPGIFTNNPNELKDLINKSEELFNKVQIDIVDGFFAEDKTILPDAMKYIETNLKLDFHLMVKDPVNWVEKCAIGGADGIIGHVEMMVSQQEFIASVSAVGAKVGLALDVKTPLDDLDKDLLTSLDVILLKSSVDYKKEIFEPSVFEKVENLRKTKVEGEHNFTISVDGGISFDNVRKLMENGCDEVVAGKTLLENNLEDNKRKYEEILRI